MDKFQNQNYKEGYYMKNLKKKTLLSHSTHYPYTYCLGNSIFADNYIDLLLF